MYHIKDLSLLQKKEAGLQIVSYIQIITLDPEHDYFTTNAQRSHIHKTYDFSQKCIKLITFITLTSTIYSQNRLWSISALDKHVINTLVIFNKRAGFF